jgi:hypothetical protein
MPQLAVAGVGAMIGGAIGGTFLGMSAAAIGWSVGSMVGSIMFAPDGPKAELQDMRSPKLQFGQKIPRVDGRVRLPCNPRWQSEWRATSHEAGGKGGGGGGSEYYTYACDALLWVCEGVDDAVGVRLWHNGKLVYSTISNEGAGFMPDPDQEWQRLIYSIVTGGSPLYSSITFFDGNATQMPWPVYEAAVGTDNADAHRGLFCVAIENYEAGQSPQMGLWECEVVTAYTQAEADALTLLQSRFISASADDESVYLRGSPVQDGGTVSAGGFEVNTDNLADPFTPNLLTYEPAGLEPNGTDALCFEMLATWVASPNTSGILIGRIVLNSGDIGTAHSFVWYQNAGKVGYRNAGFGSEYDSTIAAPANCHLAVQFAASGTRAYIDGIKVWESLGPAAPAVHQMKVEIGDISGYSDSLTQFTVHGFRVRQEEVYTGDSFTPPTEIPAPDGSYDLYTPIAVDLADIVTAECVRSGLDASLIDVTELAGTDVTGFVRQGSGREAIEQLMAFYYFGCTCRDVLLFRDLGGASAETIPFEDTGVGNDKAGEPFTGVDRGNDQEVPAYWSLSTPDIDADYEAGTETSDRMITASVEKRQVQMTVIATPAERKGRAQALALRARVESHKFEATLDNSHAELEPFDVVTYTDEDGNTYRTRSERESYDGLVKRFEGVLDSANLPTEGETSATYTPTINIVAPGTVDGMLLDAPIARDADDDHGFYWVTDFASGASAASLYRSTDDVSFSNVEISTSDAITGTAAAALGDWAGGNVWDEVNSVRVTVTGALTASTREAMELDPTINAAALGVHGAWEYFRFRTPTLVSSTATSYTYDLTGLLRGRNGTEHAMAGHTSGEVFVLLRLAGLRRVSQDSDQAGLARYYKHVVAGRSVSGATSESFTNAAVGRKPYAPVDGQVSRDGSGNATLTWARRTRLSHRLTGPLAWSFPLGEATEAYVVTIYTSNTYATVARTIAATSETAAYSAADQTTDFGSPQSTIYFTVAQVSETVGNGYEHRAAA